MRTSRYKLLVDRMATEIRTGRLAPGTRLPTHRQLAAKEGLALVTASRVYAELGAMGLVSGVRNGLPASRYCRSTSETKTLRAARLKTCLSQKLFLKTGSSTHDLSETILISKHLTSGK